VDQKDSTAKNFGGHYENPYPWDAPKKENTWICCGQTWPNTYNVCPCCEKDRPE
jgi:hypothetical protein